jgi:hypothetical protein
MTGVAGEGLIEGVEKNEGEHPEDNLGGNAFLFDDLFVEVFFAHVSRTPLPNGLDADGSILAFFAGLEG